VPDVDRTRLPPEVREHEPAGALFGGPDGLDVIRRLLPVAAAALAPGGVLIMEIGQGQAASVTTLVAAAGLRLRTIEPDLAGIPRVVVASRPA
jgi:release factor glutamine methyltransferase